MTMSTIYGFAVNGEVRYVGQTRRPIKRRLREMKATAVGGYGRNVKLMQWIKENSEKVETVQLEAVSASEALARELDWIEHLQQNGHRLFNIQRNVIPYKR